MAMTMCPPFRHQPLVRPHWLTALAVTVNRFTCGPKFRHFVMAVTRASVAGGLSKSSSSETKTFRLLCDDGRCVRPLLSRHGVPQRVSPL